LHFPQLVLGVFISSRRATQIAVNEAKHFLSENSSFERVIFVALMMIAIAAISKLFQNLLVNQDTFNFNNIRVYGWR
jgi:hypothetical protein